MACSSSDTLLRLADTYPSAEELQARIEREIEPGASHEEVVSWTVTDGADTGISTGDSVYKVSDPGGPNSPLDQPGDVYYNQAIIRGRFGGLLVFFILDEEMRFSRVIVEEYFNP